MIKDIIDRLAESDKRKLLHAFENELSQRVELGQDRFLGVHISKTPDLRIIEEAGAWTVAERSKK